MLPRDPTPRRSAAGSSRPRRRRPAAGRPPPRPPRRRRPLRRAAAAATAGAHRRGRRRRLGAGLDDRHAGRGRRQRQRRHAHRFRLAAENHLHAPVRIELDHLRRHLIDDPDVVLRIDAHLLRLQETVRALADLADELAGPIELEQPRSAVRHGARGAERHRRVAGPGVEEDVALGVGGDAGRFTHVDVVGETSADRRRIERHLGNRDWATDPAAGARARCREHAP